jgi:hypothetical protein
LSFSSTKYGPTVLAGVIVQVPAAASVTSGPSASSSAPDEVPLMPANSSATPPAAPAPIAPRRVRPWS